ncbi:BppU family phage baseplate upper protein [Staphylococcus agnetis]|uniref:BppU family phage baseplate upper protein n=1 Tax=Staphylococcus agnetis TaxID=985762 RepID=UPI001FB20DBE|nr:BppU family phage baseplate upper protein [Staphylococcus agnetis]UOC12387.1 BppU family phage baseplate upper protein [Staphylococcus agnetis]
MTNLDKIGVLKQENTPYYKPISSTQIGFYNTDSNTAQLRFIVHRDGFPYQLGPVNITGYLWLKSSNGSMSGQLDLEIVDSSGGILGATIPNEFLKAATETECEGQILLAVNGTTDIATLGKFTLYVGDSLPNQIKGEVKVQYFRMFDDLKHALEQKVSDIEASLATLGDYVTQVQDASQQALDRMEIIKNEVTSTINNVASTSKNELLTLLAQYKSDVETTANNSESSIQAKVDEGNKTIDTKVSESQSYINSKIQEFKNAYNSNGFTTPTDVDNKINALNWQKIKVTTDNGVLTHAIQFDFNDLDNALSQNPYLNFVVSNALNTPMNLSNYGLMTNVGTGNYKIITYYPYSSPEKFITNVKWGGSWQGWRLNGAPNDTGWIEFFLLNGAISNSAFNSDGEQTGFKCAYRKVISGGVTTNYLRLNGSNVTSGQVVAQLPSTFTKYSQSFPVRVPVSSVFAGGYVTIRPSGEVRFYVNGETSGWNTSSGYFYGEMNWTD